MHRMTSITEGSVIAFGAESSGFDTIYGFRPGRDRLAFGEGFFAPMAVRAPLSWRLRACSGAGGRALLAANTAWAGWRFIADFAGLDRPTLAAAIADGRLVAGDTAEPKCGAGASPLPHAREGQGEGVEPARQQA